VAVVDDRDELEASAGQSHPDAGGPGVDGVLAQLLHHAGRSLDDLAGRDLVDERIAEVMDSTHISRRTHLTRR